MSQQPNFFSSLPNIAAATLRVATLVQNAKYTPYPIGSPHEDADIQRWPGVAMANCVRGESAEIGSDEHRYRVSNSVAYTMIDRGVSRAQGLLQFNSIVSIVLSGGALILSFGQLGALISLLLFASLLLLAVSTLLSLTCLWIIWYAPETSLEDEARMTWEVWLQRSLLFNVSLVLAIPAFCGVSLAVLLKALTSIV